MVDYITEGIAKVNQAQGLSLAAVGMIVVFFGLLSLFIAMKILHGLIIYFEKRSPEKQPGTAIIEIEQDQDEQDNLDEIAAAIGLALHIYKSQHGSNEIKINRAMSSSWKQSQRAIAMQRM